MTDRSAVSLAVRSFGTVDEDDEPDPSQPHPLLFATDRVGELTAALEQLGYSCSAPETRSSEELNDAVLDAIEAGQPESIRIVHVISHGHLGETGALHVVGADGEYRHANVEAWLQRVVEKQEAAPQTLFLLDLCHAGQAARLGWQLRVASGRNRAWVIAAAAPDHNAFDGRFTRAVAQVLRTIADASRNELDIDPTQAHVPLATVAREIRRETTKLADLAQGLPQEVTATLVDLAAEQPDIPFFPNPGFEGGAHQDLRARATSAVRPFLDGITGQRRVADDPRPKRARRARKVAPPTADVDRALDAEHFRDRGRGHGPVRAQAATGLFTGRKRELRILSEWFDGYDRDVLLRVVTGSPGAGKSALLGVLVCAAHPALRDSTQEVWSNVDYSPHANGDLAAVHARQRDLAEIRESLARQLLDAKIDASTTEGLFAGLVRRSAQAVVVIDALDEAIGGVEIMTDLLLPLLGLRRPDGGSACRLLVAGRPWEEFQPLLDAARAGGGLLNLDEVPTSTLRRDLETYVDQLLRAEPAYETTKHAGARATLASATADALVAEDRGGAGHWGHFLAAGLFVHHVLTAYEPLVDPERAEELGASVPQDLPSILELDLAARPDRPWLRPVLAALARARGEGMPAGVVGRVAPALGGPAEQVVLSAAQVAEAMDSARFYLRYGVDSDGTTLYRLFHQSLADHLRKRSGGVTESDDEKSVFVAFLRPLRTSPGYVDWDLAEPYLLRHLLAHAVEAGVERSLLEDPEFLLRADPHVVLPEVERVSDQGELQGDHQAWDAYRGFVDDLGEQLTSPLERRQALALRAARAGARSLVRSLAAPLGVPLLPWVVSWTTGDPTAVAAPATERPVAAAVAVVVGPVLGVVVQDLERRVQLGDALVGPGARVVAVTSTTVDVRAVVVTGASDGHVVAYDLLTRTALWTRRMSSAVRAVTATLLDGRPVLVVGGDDRKAHVLDAASGEPLREPLQGFMTGAVLALGCMEVAGEPAVVAGCAESKVVAWSLRTGEVLDQRGRLAAAVRTLAIVDLPDGPVAAFPSGRPGDLVLWRPRGTSPHLIEVAPSGRGRQQPDRITALAATRWDGEPVVLAGTASGGVRIVRPGGTVTSVERPSAAAVLALGGATLDGRAVFVGSGDDGVFRAWDPDGQLVSETLLGAGGVVALASVQADFPSRALMGSAGGGTDRRAAVTAIGAAARPSVVLTGDSDGGVRMWDIENASCTFATATPRPGPVVGVEGLLLGGEFAVAARGHDDVVRVWHVASGQLLLETDAGSPVDRPGVGLAPVRATSSDWIVRDGQLVRAIGSDDGSVSLQPVGGGAPVAVLRAHDGAVTAVEVAVLRDRPVLVTGGEDCTVHLIDAAALEVVETVPVPAPVHAVLVAGDDRIVVHAGGEALLLERTSTAPGTGR